MSNNLHYYYALIRTLSLTSITYSYKNKTYFVTSH